MDLVHVDYIFKYLGTLINIKGLHSKLLIVNGHPFNIFIFIIFNLSLKNLFDKVIWLKIIRIKKFIL